MIPEELRQAIREAGFRIGVGGGRLRVAGRRERLTPELQQLLNRYASNLCCGIAGQLMQCPRLYRCLPVGSRVQTEKGPGKVLQVFPDRLTVLTGGDEHTTFFDPEEAAVISGPRRACDVDV